MLLSRQISIGNIVIDLVSYDAYKKNDVIEHISFENGDNEQEIFLLSNWVSIKNVVIEQIFNGKC